MSAVKAILWNVQINPVLTIQVRTTALTGCITAHDQSLIFSKTSSSTRYPQTRLEPIAALSSTVLSVLLYIMILHFRKQWKHNQNYFLEPYLIVVAITLS